MFAKLSRIKAAQHIPLVKQIDWAIGGLGFRLGHGGWFGRSRLVGCTTDKRDKDQQTRKYEVSVHLKLSPS
ncbi:MAG: hypothetical protein WBM15_05000, partial [Chromatiaceae bacterium]